MHQTSTSRSIVRIAVFALAASYVFGQAPAVIQIDMENYTAYYADNPDYSKLASSQKAVAAVSTNTFARFSGLADIVRVNGEPAKGTWSVRGTITNYTPTPQPGQAIADTTRQAFVDWVWEIQKADGTPIGTIMASGMGHGPAPPGSPLALSPTAASSMAITGGTGAFLGVRGQAGFKEIAVPTRVASVAEDPSVRRTLGGGKRSFLLTLIPLASPAILTNSAGPVVAHSADFSMVSSDKPAVPGEILIVIASALGPTNPGVDPGQAFPSSPLAIANSPIEATVNGSSAQVLYAGGYPGTTNLYQVNLQLPPTVQPGMAVLQLTSAWQPSNSVQIAIGNPGR
jgi:uncharacterized protein (TIGR03437 family)